MKGMQDKLTPHASRISSLDMELSTIRTLYASYTEKAILGHLQGVDHIKQLVLNQQSNNDHQHEIQDDEKEWLRSKELEVDAEKQQLKLANAWLEDQLQQLRNQYDADKLQLSCENKKLSDQLDSEDEQLLLLHHENGRLQERQRFESARMRVLFQENDRQRCFV